MDSKFATDKHIEDLRKQASSTLSGTSAGQKKCPFCAELIQSEAIKCRYCGEFLDGISRSGSKPPGEKWYFTTRILIIALLCIGPLALPLAWLNPRYKIATKTVITIIVLIVTVICAYLVADIYNKFLDQFSQLGI